MSVKVCNIDEVVKILDFIHGSFFKIGFDIHGVLTRYPSIFSLLTRQLIKQGHEVHIITGSKSTSPSVVKLKNVNIQWTHFFSITDYHESIGTKVKYDENGPWIDEVLWNKTKGEYAKRCGLDLHIDDSEVYGEYFPKTMSYLLLKG